MTDVYINNNDISSRIDLLVDEKVKTNAHINAFLDILKVKYNLTPIEENVLYSNVEKIVNVAIIRTNLDAGDYKCQSVLWQVIHSKYLMDTVCEFARIKNSSLKRNQNLFTNVITDNFAKEYFDEIVLRYNSKESDSSEYAAPFSVEENGLSTDTSISKPHLSIDELLSSLDDCDSN